MNSAIENLARPEIVALDAYVPAGYAEGLVRLNANEAPWTCSEDSCERPLNHYPPARPDALTNALAAHYSVANDQVFVTRGSSEAIDLLIRCFCRPGVDEIITCPPTFGMYKVYAQIQNAAVQEVPLAADKGFSLDVDAILAAWRGTSRLLFLTTPNNPTANTLAVSDIDQLALALIGRGIVVIDAAYIEFADPAAVMALLAHENVVVLRTLSKAYAMAGARCGALIGSPTIIALMSKVMPPYALATPTVEIALAALADKGFAQMPARIAQLKFERDKLAGRLSKLTCVRKVWPSDANFLLTEFSDPLVAIDAARNAGLLLRDFSSQSGTENCVRITIGTAQDNDTLVSALTPLN